MGLWQILKGEQPGLLKSVLHYRNAGQFGEYLIDYALQSNGIEGERVVLTNLYLPMKGKTTEIDLLMLHEKGIFVIESKYYSGWIFGSEDQLKWTQCFRNGRKEHFYNPVKQNRTHIRALAEYLSMPEEAFSSYVVFSERCTLKKVPRYFDGDITVCRRHKMLRLMRKRIKDAPVEDVVERLIISGMTHEIAYNRRVGNHKRVSMTFEMPEAVKDLLAWYEEQPLFEPGEVNPKPVTKEGISRTYQITTLYTDKKSASYTGSFDKEGLPGNWANFIGRVAAFFDTESLGEMFNARTFDRVPAKTDDAVFCGVEILGVVGARYYRCDDDVCLGDVVIVPTPAKKQNLAGQVVELRRCKATAIPKELQKAKDVLYIIRDGDAENHG